jgi:hypothetical protein
MKPTSFDAIAAAAGLLCGTLSNYGILQGSWWNLAFWDVAGVVLGFFASDRKEALRGGVWYGMVLVLSFLFSGFKGGAAKLLGFSLLAVVGAVIGGACGLVLGLIGHHLKRAPR